MERTAALEIHIEPELAGIRDPFDRVLGWAGVLAVLAFFLPIVRESGGALWYWHLLSGGESFAPALAQSLGGTALIALSFARRPRLDKAIAAIALLSVASVAVLSDGRAAGDLLVLFPRPFAQKGVLFVLSTAFAAASVAWRTGPFAEQRSRLPSLVLAIASLATALPLIGSTLMTSVLPVAVAAYALQASLQNKKQEATAIGWVIAIPAGVIITVGFKGALAFGDGALLLLGVRGAALFASFVMIASFSITSSLSQLIDPLGAEATRPTHLLRDELLHRILQETVPQIARHTAGYRSLVVRLVRLRFDALLDDARQEFPPVRTREELLLRMRRQLIDDRDPVAPQPPITPRWIHFLAKRRHLELSLLALALASAALLGLVHLASIPRAEDWPLGPEQPWMAELYQRRLPNIGIACGGGDYAGRDRRLRRAIADAAELAEPVPDLAGSIRTLTPLVIALPEKHRALERAIDQINEAARDNGVPFYIDVDIVPVRRGGAYLHYVYVKSYKIERVRHAKEGLGEYTALWLSRADRTNILDARLGWTRQNEHHGMIVLDVVREYWLSDVAPALAGLEETRVQRIYGKHAERLTEEIASASAELLDLPAPAWRAVLEARLDCFVDERPECAELAEVVDAAAVEVLARKVETHELQHVIDGAALLHPEPLRMVMASYSEDAITFAAAELSAYLAEVARSGQPRIALVHFLALAAVQPYSPEGFAGRVALEHLVRGQESGVDLLDLPAGELADRARAAHEALFGRSLGDLTRKDA